ncbi:MULTISPECIES: shikimate dehydrogenase [Ramlibacter]|uniref:Shikimate dehydrogenase (NADP(+)) n=1 Tax=Ramlibacter pinisoli TaxID=2682844 RepID=A0A6N8J281_9BURK|nr:MULTISPECIES: shikimate dehydrogenase [Ramlibacter]MBA2962458.1 shikimate dehydrogenase [Ramlibacter sp. CGMCC 1.13660]MVQ32400.1 shikimate dehydrogenase [Ramlibacter pinisoli]
MTPDAYCVVGNPVAHSRSPWIHARFARQTGEPVQYERLLAPLDGFAAALRAFRAGGGRGCNVTVPFKFEAAALATARTERARLAGACNTLRFDPDGAVFGDNTDGAGLVNDIQRNAGVDLVGRDVLLVGGGGAAAGVLGPLLEARPRRVVVANRTVSRALALLEGHAALAAASGVDLGGCGLDAVPAGFHVVLNATAASLSGGGVPVPGSALAPGALAYDMMYGPPAQGFLQWAHEHGARGRDGLGMLVEQAAESFLVWRGVRPDTDGVLAELRALLAAG